MTLQEMIDKAAFQSGAASSVVEVLAESLLPQVFQDVSYDFCGDERRRSLPKIQKTVTFTNGSATLSTDVLVACKFDSELYNSSDPTSIYSLVPNWDDFIRIYDTRLGYYCIKDDDTIYVIEPGSTYEEGDGLDGSRRLVIACVPAVPSSASSTIDAPGEFVNETLTRLVARVKELATV